MSALICAYNGERWISESLGSILSQTEPPEETIVVNDGSTDGTRALLADFEDRVRVIDQENRGVCAATNRALSEASGDYVALCGQDDIWEAAKLECQRDALAAHPEIDVAFTRMRSFGSSDRDFRRPPGRGLLDRRAFSRALFEQNCVGAPSAAIRRSLFAELGGFREDLAAEDYEFWFRALRGGARFYFDERRLVRYRTHPGSLSAQEWPTLEMKYSVRRQYAVDLDDRALVDRVLARDLRSLGRYRMEAGLGKEARDAYARSLRHRFSPKAIFWSVALSSDPLARAARAVEARVRRPRAG